MENGPFEDLFPIENVDFPASYVSLPEGIAILDIHVSQGCDPTGWIWCKM